MLLQNVNSLEAWDEVRKKELTNVAALRKALDRMLKDVSISYAMRCTSVQKEHSARMNVLLFNSTIGDYVVIQLDTWREHKLHSKWRRLMTVKADK